MRNEFVISVLRNFIHKKLAITLSFIILLVLFSTFFSKKYEEKNKLRISDGQIQTKDYLNQYKKIENYKAKFLYNSKWKKIVPNKRDVNNIPKNIVILEYTKIFGNTKYCQKFEQNVEEAKKELYLSECPYKNCIFTCDKSHVNNVQALIFHQSDLETKLKYFFGFYSRPTVTESERKNQIWILWNDEPNKVDKSLDNFEFNWTMSYRIDSEVSDCSYGCMYRKMIQKSDNLFKNIKLNFKLKKNEAVWFVSNCEPKFRISFAKQLKEHFPVKVFGACSSYFEPFFKRFYSKKDKCSRDSGCEHEQLIQNKFYLSFESKNCSNYLTEKVWKMLHIGIIPVVIQPSKQFYELNLPPNSFIHAQDFNYDAQKLAKYLNYVANDFDTYYSYLKWKLEYQVVFSAFQTERRRLCELCTRLNTEDSLIYYNSVSDFFNDQCILN